ncbi:phosphonopyruvate decarboxylase [Sporosarcina ureilytica]|uniref:Phosphonopyruvate decarboxylase n=2 Tax=Sporosarcina ureilytica TaxID=298596 RepID=A0A1D8JKL2_9BACL|nr:phosphonopyruvate decarboxylase [Sporosarcina ureilytica]AOV09254.1 phosphonopyruvate decarboxylase [Sporosarcina ureilytica]
MHDLGKELDTLGFNFYSGVPCSFLKSMINYAINKEQFVMSANEGDAVAICAGAHLGGKKTVFLCQNSGITNAVSPLTSLNQIFEIPVLGFVSLRGEEGISDEPQHELMGKITKELLDTMQIANEQLSSDIDEAKQQLKRADALIEQGESFFFIVKKKTLGPVQLTSTIKENETLPKTICNKSALAFPKRIEALREIQNTSDSDTILLATTGVTGRELYELEDKKNQLYMVGSMGCVSSLGLGLALARPDKKVIAIDGDGAFLMRMGAITTNAYYAPNNFYHLLLDNGMHESTGGQATVSSNVDFIKIVEGARYPQIVRLSNLNDLQKSLKQWHRNLGLTFGYLKTSPGVKEDLARPKVKPFEVKNRLIKYISGDKN